MQAIWSIQHSFLVFGVPVDIVKVDALAWWKISKRYFLKDIAKSFHENLNKYSR